MEWKHHHCKFLKGKGTMQHAELSHVSGQWQYLKVVSQLFTIWFYNYSRQSWWLVRGRWFWALWITWYTLWWKQIIMICFCTRPSWDWNVLCQRTAYHVIHNTQYHLPYLYIIDVVRNEPCVRWGCGVLPEMLKAGGEMVMKWLVLLFNMVWR